METKIAGNIVHDVRVRRPGARNRLVLLLVFALLLAGVGAVSYFTLFARHPALVLEHYDVAAVQRKNIESVGQFSGVVDFATTSTLLAPVSAAVERVLVNAGDSVAKGQTLLVLSAPELSRGLSNDALQRDRKVQAKERLVLERELETARNDKELLTAQTTVDRTAGEAELNRKLLAVGAVSPAETQAAERAAAQAQADLTELRVRIDTGEKMHRLALAGAELDLREAQAKLDDDQALFDALQVKSPFAGKIIQVIAHVGTPVDARAALMTVVDQAAPVVKFDIPEQNIGLIARGQSVDLIVSGTHYSGTLADIAATATGGTVTTSSTVAVSAAFRTAVPGLLPGVSAEVRLRLGFRENALTLPKGAYLTTGGDHAVFVLNGDKAVRREVAFGLGNTQDIEIVSGLTEGEKVIVSSYEDFAGNDSVQVTQGGNGK